MAAGIYTFWPSFPMLEAAPSALPNYGLWHFDPNSFGNMMDCQVQYEVGRRPKLPWPLVAIHFGLPSQCWKQPQHCPYMVYGILVQILLESWWIFNSNMRLGGDPKKLAAVHFGLPSNIGNNPQHRQCWFMVFWSNIFGVFVALHMEYNSRRGHKKTWHQGPYICAFPPNVVNGLQHC